MARIVRWIAAISSLVVLAVPTMDGTLLFALVLPLVSAALTLLYLDLAVRRDSEEPPAGMLPAP